MIIDGAVHPFMPNAAYLERLPYPWRDHYLGVPNAFGRLFEAPLDEIADQEAAADPARTAETLFGERGADVAVLAPLTRGMLPNRLHAAVVATITNEWLREVWLDSPEGDRFFGSIRVAVADPEAAVREIERWAGDPRFVQIAVPLRAWAHYGDEQYFPIWEAAAAAGLPVYIQDDLANGAEWTNSPTGQPVHFAENDAQRPFYAIIQLASIIGSGLHRRLPELRFIFGDGGLELAPALLWRLNNEWRNGGVEVPWIEEMPSVLASRFARFVTQVHDHRPDGETVDVNMVRVSQAETMAVYGSHHPYWDGVARDDAVLGLSDAGAARVLSENLLEVSLRLATALAHRASTA